MTNEELQMQGANDRALGRSPFDCPWFAADKVPAATGEATEAWAAKVEQWNVGWRLEDAMRTS